MFSFQGNPLGSCHILTSIRVLASCVTQDSNGFNEGEDEDGLVYFHNMETETLFISTQSTCNKMLFLVVRKLEEAITCFPKTLYS